MKRIKKIKYYFQCEKDFEDRMRSLELLDMLGFKANIAIYFFRATPNSQELIDKFSEKTPCKVVRDAFRSDCFMLFIPKLLSYMLLFPLISGMNAQTEVGFFALRVPFETFLFHRQQAQKNSVRYGLSSFEALFDQDYGLHLCFDCNYLDKSNVCDILEKWEQEHFKYISVHRY